MQTEQGAVNRLRRENDTNCTLKTDPAVLRRVLVNMVINALEAAPKNGTVRID